MPGDANPNGGIFGGWILAQMDKAAGLLGMQRSGGGCTTIAIENVRFLEPLKVGEDFAIYGVTQSVGRTSMRLELTGWAVSTDRSARKIVEGLFVSVALDIDGRPRPVPALEHPEAS